MQQADGASSAVPVPGLVADVRRACGRVVYQDRSGMASWQNGAYPKPEPDIWANAFTFGVTRPAPLGVQKFTWNTKTRSFEKNWINNEIDNTDVMVPVISAASRMIYLAHKQNGVYEYVGVDWDTGEIKARWPFPDASHQWNAYGGITALLEDGDLLIGGAFAIKRVHMGDGK
jgi:hypothetical protein